MRVTSSRWSVCVAVPLSYGQVRNRSLRSANRFWRAPIGCGLPAAGYCYRAPVSGTTLAASPMPSGFAARDRLAHVAGRQMPVMLLDHAGVGIAEVARHNHQRRAVRCRRGDISRCRAAVVQRDLSRHPTCTSGDIRACVMLPMAYRSRCDAPTICRHLRCECDAGGGYPLDRRMAYRVADSAAKRRVRSESTIGGQDKSTAVGRGACGWLDWKFLSAPTSALLAHPSEKPMISVPAAPSPALGPRPPRSHANRRSAAAATSPRPSRRHPIRRPSPRRSCPPRRRQRPSPDRSQGARSAQS